MYSIVYQKNSNELLYIGTQFGVMYKDKTMSEWQIYGSGFPKTQAHHLHINYNQRQLRVASYGRGIYEANLLGETKGDCDAPKDLTVISANSSSIQLGWSRVLNSKNYYVSYKKTTENNWKSIPNLTTNVVSIDNLAKDTEYDISVSVTCNDESTERTSFRASTTMNDSGLINGGIYEIKSALPSHRNLDVAGGGTGNAANVHIWGDTNTNNQRWIARELEGGHFAFSPVHAPSKALDVQGRGTVNETNIHIWDFSADNPAQQWKVEQTDNKYYTLSPSYVLDKSLDVHYAIDENGRNVQIWENNNSIAQKWIFEYIGQSSSGIVQNQNTVSSVQVYPTNTNKETTIFPIPAKDFFTINFKKPLKNKHLKINLINNIGVIIKDEKINSLRHSSTVDIETNSLATGIYTLLIQDDQGKQVHLQQILIRR